MARQIRESAEPVMWEAVVPMMALWPQAGRISCALLGVVLLAPSVGAAQSKAIE